MRRRSKLNSLLTLPLNKQRRDDEKKQKEVEEKALKAKLAADLVTKQKKIEDDKKKKEADEKALKAKVEADLAKKGAKEEAAKAKFEAKQALELKIKRRKSRRKRLG
jgi:hypothetical protein